MRLGFIGTGAITEALVRGLLRNGATDLAITVSVRSEAVSARLALDFPVAVQVAADNHEIVDGSDVVVLAVRPQVARDVLSRVTFRQDQTVVSLVAMLALEELYELVAPARHIIRAIPLPSAAEGGSPTAITPPDAEIRAFFERVGSVIEVSDRDAFDALGAASGIMATHFAMAAAVTSWLEKHGVAADAARAYVGEILSGLARTANASPETSFATLVGGHETRGGLNEQLRLHMAREGALDALEGGLQLLYRRIQNGG